MKKKIWIGLIPIGLMLVVVLSGCAEDKTQKVYHVGILCEAKNMDSIANGFKAKMSELGYIEGKNIFYDFNVANFDSSEEQRILKKFADEKVDLIFAFPTEAATAAKAYNQGNKYSSSFRSKHD